MNRIYKINLVILNILKILSNNWLSYLSSLETSSTCSGRARIQ